MLRFIGVFVAVAVASDETPLLWPVPQLIAASGGPLSLASHFRFIVVSGGSELLSRSVARYSKLLAPSSSSSISGLENCSIIAHSDIEEYSMATDESYNLTISDPSCRIEAPTIFGCMRGLESFAQLTNATFNTSKQLSLPHASIRVNDWPDFVHRGVMCDSGRRFWPVPLLKNVMDVMVMNKMTVHVSPKRERLYCTSNGLNCTNHST